jgi:DNA processing protein
VDRPHSQGCHRLIQEGAKLVTEPGEILTELQDLFGGWARATSKGQPAPTLFDPAGTGSTQFAPKKPLPPLSEDEEKIYRIISEHGGTQLDVIIETSGFSNAVISSLLLSLQMKQVVRQAPGNQFVLA